MAARRIIHKVTYYYKIVNNLTPSYLTHLLPTSVSERTHFPLRSSQNLLIFLLVQNAIQILFPLYN